MSPSEVPPVEKLYEKLLARSSLPLPGLEDAVIDRAWKRASRIHAYLGDRADRMEEDCMLCYEKKARRSQTRCAYDTPWEDEPHAKYFCSDDCGDTYMYEEPWAYFWCDGCDREISGQHPQNGWQIQYRMVDDEQICLRCYQDKLLEEGHAFEREKLESGEIPGMFFSYGNPEPKEAGYTEVPGFTDYFVNGPESAERFGKKALRLIDEGQLIVIGYERLAIGGSEGYVTMLAKESVPMRQMVETR